MHTACLKTVYSSERFIANYNNENLRDEEEAVLLEWTKNAARIKYIGGLTRNNFNDYGYYIQTGRQLKPDFIYIGKFHCNQYNGYGSVFYSDCTQVQAAFKKNRIFGPAVIKHAEREDVAWFYGWQIVRLITQVAAGCVPRLENQASGEGIEFAVFDRKCREFDDFNEAKSMVDTTKNTASKNRIQSAHFLPSNSELNGEIETSKHTHFMDDSSMTTLKPTTKRKQIKCFNDTIRNVNSKFFNESLYYKDCCNKAKTEEFLNEYCEELFMEEESVDGNEWIESENGLEENAELEVTRSDGQLFEDGAEKTKSKDSLLNSNAENRKSDDKLSKINVSKSSRVTSLNPCGFTEEELHLILAKSKITKRPSNGELPEDLLELFAQFSKNIHDDNIKNMLIHSFENRHCLDNVDFDLGAFLRQERTAFNRPGVKETACCAFLHKCRDGNVSAAKAIFNKFNLHPDVCDSSGNSGLHFAVVGNKRDVLRMLSEFGADLNKINDDGLDGLMISMLKCLAIEKDVGFDDWNRAFLDKHEKTDKNDEHKPNAKADKLNAKLNDIPTNTPKEVDLTLVEFEDCAFFENTHDFYYYTRRNENTTESFSSINLNPKRGGVKYLFDLSLVKTCKDMLKAKKPAKKKKKKGKKGAKKSKKSTKDGDTKSKKSKKSKKGGKRSKKSLKTASTTDHNLLKNYSLSESMQTFRLLVDLGADLSTCTYPIPLLFLSLFFDGPQMLEVVLKHGNNLDIGGLTWGEDRLTPLHVLAAVPTKTAEMILTMVDILLRYGVDLNARTGPQHWPEERKCIIGDYPEADIVDGGKTALHILAMRRDLEEPDAITARLVTAGAFVEVEYLGHTVLSLAVLKGNGRMVRALLENGAKIERALGNGMGKALSVLFLKRYENFLRDDFAKYVHCLECLLEKENPFNAFAGCGNVFEFIRADEVKSKPVVAAKKRGKKGKSAKKKSKKGKKGKKKTKVVVKTRALLLKRFIKLAQSLLHKHHCAKCVLYLLNATKNAQLHTDFCSRIATYLTVNTAIEIIVLLLQRHALDITIQHTLVLKLLLFINAQSLAQFTDEEIVEKVAHIKTRFSFYTSYEKAENNPKKIAKIWAHDTYYKDKRSCIEFDADFAKYNLCFNCLLGAKTLKLCPVCSVVAFCSERCEKAFGKSHACNTPFYKKDDDGVDDGEEFEDVKRLYRLIAEHKAFWH